MLLFRNHIVLRLAIRIPYRAQLLRQWYNTEKVNFLPAIFCLLLLFVLLLAIDLEPELVNSLDDQLLLELLSQIDVEGLLN